MGCEEALQRGRPESGQKGESGLARNMCQEEAQHCKLANKKKQRGEPLTRRSSLSAGNNACAVAPDLRRRQHVLVCGHLPKQSGHISSRDKKPVGAGRPRTGRSAAAVVLTSTGVLCACSSATTIREGGGATEAAYISSDEKATARSVLCSPLDVNRRWRCVAVRHSCD